MSFSNKKKTKKKFQNKFENSDTRHYENIGFELQI